MKYNLKSLKETLDDSREAITYSNLHWKNLEQIERILKAYKKQNPDKFLKDKS